jgi:hypothetical protein
MVAPSVPIFMAPNDVKAEYKVSFTGATFTGFDAVF